MSNTFYVITFYSTHLALQFERRVQERQLAARLIPVPRQISSSCGLAGKFAPKLLSEIQSICTEHGIEYENIYAISKEKGSRPEVVG